MKKKETPKNTPPPPSSADHRAFTRVDAEIAVKTTFGDAVISKGITRNISVKGAFIECEKKPLVGTECKIFLSFLEKSAPYSIPITAKVIRIESEGVAIEFQSMQITSLEQLKNIILCNSAPADSSRIENEVDRVRPFYDAA